MPLLQKPEDHSSARGRVLLCYIPLRVDGPWPVDVSVPTQGRIVQTMRGQMESMKLWNKVFKTNPNDTKDFQKTGGFRGTAVDPMTRVRKATEVFGPIGLGWGYVELETKIEEKVWFTKLRLWYFWDDEKGMIEQWGSCPLVQNRKNGPFVDEECAKKATTDAMTKCLSLLGFNADVHMGLFDDNKYVQTMRKEFTEKKSEPTDKEKFDSAQDWHKKAKLSKETNRLWTMAVRGYQEHRTIEYLDAMRFIAQNHKEHNAEALLGCDELECITIPTK